MCDSSHGPKSDYFSKTVFYLGDKRIKLHYKTTDKTNCSGSLFRIIYFQFVICLRLELFTITSTETKNLNDSPGGTSVQKKSVFSLWANFQRAFTRYRTRWFDNKTNISDQRSASSGLSLKVNLSIFSFVNWKNRRLNLKTATSSVRRLQHVSSLR